MTDVQNRSQQQFGKLDETSAKTFLREASIGRQQQSGSLDQKQVENIRMGKQDQSIGFDDAVYGLTHSDVVWDKAQQSLGMKQGSQT